VKHDEEVSIGRNRENGGIDKPIASNVLFKLSKSSQSIKANPITSPFPPFPPVKIPKRFSPNTL
jgi:hypothetical protein